MHTDASPSAARLHTEIRVSARKAAAARLAAEMRQKDQFIATVAHELRNMMAPLSSALDLLDLGKDGVARRALPVARRQVRHLSYLVEELLDVGRIASGQALLTRSEFRLQDVVREAVEACEGICAGREQQLSVDLGHDDARVLGDPVRWAQVAMNLLHNASKFTPAGGSIRVTLAVDDEEGMATLKVADTGRGIARSELESIFEMFRVGSRSAAEGGLGIGLALVRRLVELHGGTIHAESAGRGRGATFVVRVPVQTPAALRRRC